MPGDVAPVSAPLARRLAGEGCAQDPESGESCAWYHGFWPYLRLLGLGSAPQRHAEVYATALAAHPRRDRPLRLLISGAADEAMLEVLLDILGPARERAEITLLDRCPTPLALGARLAEHRGITLTTACCDALAFSSERPFDIICTHSFLGYFAPERRKDLAARWFELLRPGGRVVTINRVRPDLAGARAGFTAAQTEALLERLRAAAAARPDALDLPLEDLLAMARDFCARMRPYPVRTTEELGALFGDAGFRLERLAPAERGAAGPSGPTVPGGADYIAVVAVRPEA